MHLRAGYSSLFAYCEVLALSDHEAFNRIEAARTARRFPVVLDLLTAVRLLHAPVHDLEPEGCVRVLRVLGVEPGVRRHLHAPLLPAPRLRGGHERPAHALRAVLTSGVVQ